MSRLSDVKVGDTLVIRNRYHTRLETVTRLTSTQIITRPYALEHRYRKKDGRKIGTSSWNVVWAGIATPGDVQAVTEHDGLTRLRSTDWREVPATTRTQVLEVFEPWQSIDTVPDLQAGFNYGIFVRKMDALASQPDNVAYLPVPVGAPWSIEVLKELGYTEWRWPILPGVNREIEESTTDAD